MIQSQQEIRNKALQLLSRREYSKKELQIKLSRSFNGEESEQVLNSLAEQGLQSDKRFCEGFLRGRLRQGYGPIRIQGELKQKGIDSQLIHELLSSLEIDWFQQARETHARRFGHSSTQDIAIRAKQIRFLQYRGYTLEQANYALEAED